MNSQKQIMAKAFFASLDKLGAFIFKDFESGKRKTVY